MMLFLDCVSRSSWMALPLFDSRGRVSKASPSESIEKNLSLLLPSVIFDRVRVMPSSRFIRLLNGQRPSAPGPGA